MLSLSRIGLAVAFARTLDDGSAVPLVAFALAAATDYADGPLARRAGRATAYGVLLDSGADIAFVLIALSSSAAVGRISWVAPAAVASSAAPYLVATLRGSRAQGGPIRAYSVVGHWAGICNYALAGLLAGSVALPAASWAALLPLGSAVVVAINLAAVATRLRRGRGSR